MPSWREQILTELAPQVARLVVAADPDQLLLDEIILQHIREMGFEIITYDDPIAFRYVFESRFRTVWDRGEKADTGVVVRIDGSDLSSVPYDLLSAGLKLSFSLADIFDGLSYPVVSELDKADLDTLYRAREIQGADRLGDRATKDFIVRHVFEIAPELIAAPSDLLRVLLRLHYKRVRLPEVVGAWLAGVLAQRPALQDWPIVELISDRDEFMAFLQERWRVFLDRLAEQKSGGSGIADTEVTLEIPGPADIPFDHDDVKVYVDNLFVEGLLRPVSHPKRDVLENEWVTVGLEAASPQLQHVARLERLIDTVQTAVPTRDARHRDWLTYAYTLAELTVAACAVASNTTADVVEQITTTMSSADDAFEAWVERRYAALYNQPPTRPVMVHHIPIAIAHAMREDDRQRMALIVVDGLALDQWLVLRSVLEKQEPALRFSEDATFTWIPTTTSVCRQAIFAGKVPLYFPETITSTRKETSLWKQFWEDRGFGANRVEYAKGIDDSTISTAEELITNPKVRVLGLVVNTVDNIMHGMELGIAGMHNQVRQWAEAGFMAHLLDLLLSHDFDVFVTSDHGNIEAEGCGRPAEGVLCDSPGQRVRIYNDQVLREKTKDAFPEAIEWPPTGLPDDFLPLLAPRRKAFAVQGKAVVTHGGLSIQEVIVPFVHIERGNKRE